MAIITKGMPPIVEAICREFGYDPAQLESLEWAAEMGGVVTRVAFTVIVDDILIESVWRRDREPETRYLGLVAGKRVAAE